MPPNAPASEDAQTEGPLCKLIINVSTYREENAAYKAAMETAKSIVEDPNLSKEQKVLQSTQACLCVHKDGVKALEDSLVFLLPFQAPAGLKRQIPIKLMFGLFGVAEPSIAVDVRVPQKLIPNVKLSAIKVAEKFSQDNVHITESLWLCDMEEIPQQLGDGESWEIASLFSRGDWEDVFTVKKWAEDCDVKFLSIMKEGTQFLIYSVANRGKEQPSDPGGLEKFRAFLRRRYPLLEEKSWHMKLSNFGNPKYGATHTYNDARTLLANTLADLQGVTGNQVDTVLQEICAHSQAANLTELLSLARNRGTQAGMNQRAEESLFGKLKSCGLLIDQERIGNSGTGKIYFLTEAGWRIHDRVPNPDEIKDLVEKLG